MPASVASAAPTVAGATIKKKVDDRIRFLIDNGVQNKHRSLFFIVGDRGKDQIVNLHAMVSRAQHSAKVNMLWCMKAEPDFASTSKKKLERTGRLEVKGGMSTEMSKDAFQTFLQQTDIRFCHYKDSHKVLGQTFGMAVLQDFEALTPNILARTIETVAGGGIIVVLLRAMRSLKQLYTMVMDAHSRYRTEALNDVAPRFNERFILSLSNCDAALCVDDDLNVLPITLKMKTMSRTKSVQPDEQLRLEGRLRHEAALDDMKNKLQGNSDVGPLVKMCQTVDQARTVLSLMQAVTEKNLGLTYSVTAGRGRGKSAAIGMAIAGAIANGFSNIFVTAPSPENVNTLFEFVVRGLKEFGYKEREEFDAMQSVNPDFAKCVIRVNVFREHRQTVQFISPQDSSKFAQAELLVIDEAAAIPLPLVQKLMGSYLTFISSTVSGYEGTGRALSMKLIADMKKRGAAEGTTADGRSLRETVMSDPIRYGPEDPVEAWLNALLCLDATNTAVPIQQLPHPNSCELYYVNRDALFSFQKRAEVMLQRIVSLFVAAHYKNQPNDLQLLSDAPGHHIFALCGPLPTDDSLPDIFCVIHACEEGKVSSDKLVSNMSKGMRPSGDLIPYTLSQHFLEHSFAALSGMRIVRVATNPDVQRSGYGTRAMSLLLDYFKGNIAVTTTEKDEQQAATEEEMSPEGDTFSTASVVKPKKTVPALFLPIHERPYEPLDYVGVSYGITAELFHFWKKNGFDALYIRQAPNDLTGEHSAVMVHPIHLDLAVLKRLFLKRFLALLPLSFRALPTELALSVVSGVQAHSPQKLQQATTTEDGHCFVDGVRQADDAEVKMLFDELEMKRLKMFSTSAVELSVVLDLVPRVAQLYFSKRIFKGPDGSDGVILSHAEAAVLLSLGLQCIPLDELGSAGLFTGVKQQQLRAFFAKSVTRIVEHFGRLSTMATTTVKSSKRTREDAASKPEEAEPTIQRDSAGNIVGMSVKAAPVADVSHADTSLFRDAKVVGSSGGSGSGGSRPPKKGKKRAERR